MIYQGTGNHVADAVIAKTMAIGAANCMNGLNARCVGSLAPLPGLVAVKSVEKKGKLFRQGIGGRGKINRRIYEKEKIEA